MTTSMYFCLIQCVYSAFSSFSFFGCCCCWYSCFHCLLHEHVLLDRVNNLMQHIMLQNRHVGADKIANGKDRIFFSSVVFCCSAKTHFEWRNGNSLYFFSGCCCCCCIVNGFYSVLITEAHWMSIAILCNIITSYCCLHIVNAPIFPPRLLSFIYFVLILNLEHFTFNAWHHCSVFVCLCLFFLLIRSKMKREKNNKFNSKPFASSIHNIYAKNQRKKLSVKNELMKLLRRQTTQPEKWGNKLVASKNNVMFQMNSP